jgi:hypothetical protein
VAEHPDASGETDLVRQARWWRLFRQEQGKLSRPNEELTILQIREAAAIATRRFREGEA